MLPARDKVLSYNLIYNLRAQWLRGRVSDSRLREPRFESCAVVLKLFSLYIAPVHSAL